MEILQRLLLLVTPMDAIALAFFVAAWFGYNYVVDRDMGAYSFLSRKVGRRVTEDLITSGKIYSARELYDLGVVDVITPTGTGEAAVESFVRKHARSGNGRRGIEAIARETNPLKHEELVRVVELWADAALKLSERDMRETLWPVVGDFLVR